MVITIIISDWKYFVSDFKISKYFQYVNKKKSKQKRQQKKIGKMQSENVKKKSKIKAG